MTQHVPAAPVEDIEQRIYTVRGQRVMLDADLARIYGVETKVLNQAVKRHADRFPEDFVFQLADNDMEHLRRQIGASSLRSQSVTSRDHGGRRHLPYAFTEHGAIMTAMVLRSPQAVKMSVYVVRAFLQMRERLAANAAIVRRLTPPIPRSSIGATRATLQTLHRFPPIASRLPYGTWRQSPKVLKEGVPMSHAPAGIPTERIEHAILLIRGQKVMLDRELAVLYGVQTKQLNKAVKRNLNRFPDDFMFQLTREEAHACWGSRFQFGTLKRGRNIKYLPYAFTEQGVAMLSSVLRGSRAAQVNVAIMRAFVRLRQTLALHKDLARKLAELERKIEGHDTGIRSLFEAIRQLMAPPAPPPRPPIGFHAKERSGAYGAARLAARR